MDGPQVQQEHAIDRKKSRYYEELETFDSTEKKDTTQPDGDFTRSQHGRYEKRINNPFDGPARGKGHDHSWGKGDPDILDPFTFSWVPSYDYESSYDPLTESPETPKPQPTQGAAGESGSFFAGFFSDPLDWAFGGGGQEAHLFSYDSLFYTEFVGEGIRGVVGDEYLANAGGWELVGVTAGAVTAGVLAGWAGGAGAAALGGGGYTVAAVAGAAGGAGEYLGWQGFARAGSLVNNGGAVADMSAVDLGLHAGVGAVGGVVTHGLSSAATSAVKAGFAKPVTGAPNRTTWPRTADEMDDFLGVPGQKIPDGPTTPGRDKTVWRPNADTKITLERHPYHPDAPDWHRDYHWHLDTPDNPHQRFLPDDEIPGLGGGGGN